MEIFLWTIGLLLAFGGVIVIAQLFWEKFSKTTFYNTNENTIKKILIGCVVTLVLWWVFIGGARGGEWEGEGEISVFPDGNNVKNYRLPAEISVEVKGASLFSNYQEYSILNASWPNGGTLELIDCYPSQIKPRVFCSDQDGDEYYVEVSEPPEDNRESYSSE